MSARTDPYWCYRTLYMGPYVALCLSEDQFASAMRHLKLPAKDWPEQFPTAGANGSTCFLESKSLGGRCAVVSLRGIDVHPFAQVVGLIAHEAVHVFQFEMHEIGEKKPSKEFEAYSIQNITQALVQAYLQAAKQAKLKVPLK